MKFLSPFKRVFRVINPIVKKVAAKHKRTIYFLAFISIIMAFLPAFKSGLESILVNEVDRYIDPNMYVASEPSSRDEKFDIKFVLNRKISNISTDGFINNLPYMAVRNGALWHILLFYPIMIFLTILLDYQAEKIKKSFTKDVFVSIREKAFQKVLFTNPSGLPRVLNAPGNFSYSIQNGTNNIAGVYELLSDTLQYLLTLTISMFALISISWFFAILFLAGLVAQGIISYYRARRLKKNRNDLDKQRNALIAETDEILSKKEIILAFEQGNHYSDKLTLNARSYGGLSQKLDIRNYFYTLISRAFNEAERFLIPITVLIGVIYFPSPTITKIGGVVFLLSLYSRLSGPVLNLLSQYDQFKASEAVSNSMLDLLEKPDEALVSLPQEKDPNGNFPSVKFDQVQFSYPSDAKVFEGVSFEIPKDKVTMIIGPSGCGKSSIAKIILGYWPISGGQVHLMGQALNSYSDKQKREFCSYISQGDFLVDDSVRDNLVWGVPDRNVKDEELIEVLNKVKLIENATEGKKFLEKLAKDLAGGQQQRLSVARILIDKSPILILDEPLTGIDVGTLAEIMVPFKQKIRSGEMTVIMISHKISFANCADHLIILDKSGQVIESGGPRDLLNDENSYFHKLYKAAKSELDL